MNIIETKDKFEMSQRAFEILKNRMIKKPDMVLGAATGGTPENLYKFLRESDLDTSTMRTINLDEYVGLEKQNKNSYFTYMSDRLFNHKHFKETHLPNGMAEDLKEECERYESILQSHPIDVQIVGIGNNGHIGFNEPGTPFDSKTHIVELDESTRKANQRFFEEDEMVPTHAITMGISSIMQAKEIILLAYGESKAEALYALVHGPISEDCPASVLRNHPNVTIIADTAALSKLK